MPWGPRPSPFFSFNFALFLVHVTRVCQLSATPHAPCDILIGVHPNRVVIGAWNSMLWPIWGFRPTFLDPYVVPSPGDWAIHRGGALFIEGSENVTVARCSFIRVGGNAVFLSGKVKLVPGSQLQTFITTPIPCPAAPSLTGL